MKHEEARFILQAYRPNGADAGDPAMAEALAQARQDPGLAAWLERLQKFDGAIAAKLAEVSPPAGLRETILTGARVSQPSRQAWWRRPAGMALAASVALAGTAAIFSLFPSRAAASDLKSFAAGDAQAFHLHGEGEAWSQMQAQLAAPVNRLAARVAFDFDALRTTGCRTVSFQGRELLEVCFKREGKWFHCYIARRADFPEIALPAAPRISDVGKVHAASWADDSHIFVVISKAGREALDFLL